MPLAVVLALLYTLLQLLLELGLLLFLGLDGLSLGFQPDFLYGLGTALYDLEAVYGYHRIGEDS